MLRATQPSLAKCQHQALHARRWPYFPAIGILCLLMMQDGAEACLHDITFSRWPLVWAGMTTGGTRSRQKRPCYCCPVPIEPSSSCDTRGTRYTVSIRSHDRDGGELLSDGTVPEGSLSDTVKSSQHRGVLPVCPSRHTSVPLCRSSQQQRSS